jgi:hypothetical protein
MNETRAKAFDAALTIASIHGVDHESAEDLLDMAKRFESYLDGSESYAESGADAEAEANAPFARLNDLANGLHDIVEGNRAFRIEARTESSPAATGEAMALGTGAAAPSTSADGPPPREAGATSQGPQSSSPKKPRKKKEPKKAKAKRGKKAKAIVDEVSKVEPTTTQAIQDEVPHTEPAAELEAA